MRRVLQIGSVPEHLGLAYDAWAPVGEDGKVPDENDRRANWLSELASITVSEDYRHAYERWKESLAPGTSRHFPLTLAARLLVGHGNASATDVGISVHHTWGVPIIPGSAVKGLLAHYVDATLGPARPDISPWDQPDGEEKERARYQGLTWQDRRVDCGPGDIYRALFGSPDAEKDEVMRQHGLAAGAAAGLVTFHDALYVPSSAKDDRPFAADVLTVHQPGYYNSKGGSWPNDYDSPKPVSFLTVRPETSFLFALGGPSDWTELAEHLLTEALDKWGVGGKTSSGYGRLVTPKRLAIEKQFTAVSAATPAPTQVKRKTGDCVIVTRIEGTTKSGGPKFRVDDGIPGHFPTDAPQIAIGESATAWIGTSDGKSYSLSMKEPKVKKRP